MILLDDEKRTSQHTLWLSGSTASVAGMVNVCSVIAFFAFASNVTGHVAIFAEEIVKGHWHQVSVVFAWLVAFAGGAFTANLLVVAIGNRWHAVGRAAPVVLEMTLLAAVAHYGDAYYRETLAETEYLVGILLFAMGLHNGTVATISKGVVKTTHLTGLFTDLGMELAQVVQGRLSEDEALGYKLKLHLVILGWYVMGGLAGGVLFLYQAFQAFYVAAAILALLLAHDLVVLYRFAGSLRKHGGGEVTLWPQARAVEESRVDEQAT